MKWEIDYKCKMGNYYLIYRLFCLGFMAFLLLISGSVEAQLTAEDSISIREFPKKERKYLESLREGTSGKSGKLEKDLKSKYAIIYKTLHKEHAKVLKNAYLKEVLSMKKKRNVRLSPDVEVFGWHPYWLNSAHKNYNYNLLSTIAYFSYDINPATGGPRSQDPIRDWATTDMIDTAKAHGCKILLTITCFGYTRNKTFLDNDVTQDVMIDSLIRLIKLRDANGVNVDFEAIPTGYEVKFTDFIKKLRRRLDVVNRRYIISLALPAIDHAKVFNIKVLDKYVQQYVMMGYDYHGSFLPERVGPVAPLEIGEPVDLDLSSSVAAYLEKGVPAGKFILALPYYGLIWRSRSPDMSNPEFYDYYSYRQIKQLIVPGNRVNYDSIRNSAYIYYQDSSYYYMCWFDDKRSLDTKYKWAMSKGLRGVGIWALGYDNGETELWETITENFTTTALGTTGGRRTPTIGNFFLRYQNFIVVSVTMFLGFITLGFVRGLFDWRVREAFFEKGIFRLLFGLLLLGLLAILMIWTGFFQTRYWVLLLGMFLGVVGYYLIRFIIGFRRDRVP